MVALLRAEGCEDEAQIGLELPEDVRVGRRPEKRSARKKFPLLE